MDLLYGVLQGSVLGSLFSTYSDDLFQEATQFNICNFADDTTGHVNQYFVNDVLKLLELDTTVLSGLGIISLN